MYHADSFSAFRKGQLRFAKLSQTMDRSNREGEAIFDKLRGQWERQIGAEELAKMEANLNSLVGASPVRLDAPGWVAQDPGALA